MVVNELDLSMEWGWYRESLCQKVVESLRKNNIDAEYASDRKEALAKVKEAIPQGATIGVGDSLSLHEIGLFSWLEKEPNRVVFNALAKDPQGYNIYPPEERFELMRKTLTSDVYLASSNAVTLDGKLVNIDGRGNRVAAMIFGPRKTVLVIGANKIVKNVDEALGRIKSLCAPVNAKRHGLKHHYEAFGNLPCAVKGTCTECNSPAKICRKIVIIDGQMLLPGQKPEDWGWVSVIMVGEALGI